MSDVPPPHLQSALRRFDDAVGTLRSTVIRASELPLPPIPAPDPAELARAAVAPDAPEHLRAVARAVREGRTTWAEVAEGKGLDVPEIRDLISASGSRMASKLAEAEAELAEQDAPDDQHADPGPDDDDFEQHRIFGNRDT